MGGVPIDRAADDREFERFVTARGKALMRYGYVLTGDPHDAADLVQEALLRLRDSWSGVRRQENPEGFARTTMSRLHISWWRRRRRERLTDEVPDIGRLDPGLRRIEDDTGLWRALATVPRRQRAVLVLRYYEGQSDEQIADLLGISRGTVRSQALRGLRTLRGLVADPPPAAVPVFGRPAFPDPRRGRA